MSYPLPKKTHSFYSEVKCFGFDSSTKSAKYTLGEKQQLVLGNWVAESAHI